MTTATTPSYLAPAHRDLTFLEAAQTPTFVRVATRVRPEQMREVFDSTFRAIGPALEAQGLTVAGPPFSLHYRVPDETMDFEVGVPILEDIEVEVDTGDGLILVTSSLPQGRIATISHLGSYEGLSAAWGDLLERIADAGSTSVAPFWEVYVTEPTPDMDIDSLRTDLVTLVR